MNFHEDKGVIALDIDGTITVEAHLVPQRVVDYLASLYRAGWQLIFLTGRPFQWGFRSLKVLPFPYFLSVQNGALTLEMPAMKVIDRKYLDLGSLPKMEEVCHHYDTDFVIYTGWENGDLCYYRPQNMTKELQQYLKSRCEAISERWEAVEDFRQLPVATFSSLKCFSKEPPAFKMGRQIEQMTGLHCPVIRDPFNAEYLVIQATHHDAAKGPALRRFVRIKGFSGNIIAAGDDHNDISLLEAADIGIAMANAPDELIAKAHFIAPPASEDGIIEGLEMALKGKDHV